MDEKPPILQNGRYEIPSAAQKELGLWVLGFGYNSKKQTGLGVQRRRLGHYAAVFISRGGGWFESGPTGHLKITAGTLFWLFPDVIHSYAPGEETWAEQWVVFDGPLAERFEHQGFLSPSRPFVDVGQDPELISLWAQMKAAFFPGGPLSVSLASAFVHLLVVWAHAQATGLAGSEEKGDPFIQQALKIIGQEAFTGLSPRELALRLHLGYSTLRRRFKRQTGYALKEYMLGLRLRKAKELLAFTNLPVETVACEAGFEDPFYFSKLFRRRVGVPPMVFRQQRLI